MATGQVGIYIYQTIASGPPRGISPSKTFVRLEDSKYREEIRVTGCNYGDKAAFNKALHELEFRALGFDALPLDAITRF